LGRPGVRVHRLLAPPRGAAIGAIKSRSRLGASRTEFSTVPGIKELRASEHAFATMLQGLQNVFAANQCRDVTCFTGQGTVVCRLCLQSRANRGPCCPDGCSKQYSEVYKWTDGGRECQIICSGGDAIQPFRAEVRTHIWSPATSLQEYVARVDAQAKCAPASSGPEVRIAGREPVGSTRECNRDVQVTPARGEGDRCAWYCGEDGWHSAKAFVY